MKKKKIKMATEMLTNAKKIKMMLKKKHKLAQS
jgi:hypothetical protein